MKRFVGLFFLILILGIGCSKQMGEKDYYDLAQQYMKQGEWQQAEQTFETIAKKFPNGIYTARAIFMVGYLNANHLNNIEKARQYYQLFIDKYPQHDLADDARFELDHLGDNDIPFLKDSSPGRDENKKAATQPQSTQQN